ncbi:MAG: hypothetical protein ACHRXM_24700 [Isosphaerales bacterium]
MAIESAGGWVWYDWQVKDVKSGYILKDAKPWASEWIVDRVGSNYFGKVLMATVTSGGSDRELAHVGHLSQLEDLFLDGSSVTDAGLVHLVGLTNLKVLNLDGTKVTGTGLAHLKGLTKLSELSLIRNQVSDARVQELQQALPSVTIYR